MIRLLTLAVGVGALALAVVGTPSGATPINLVEIDPTFGDNGVALIDIGGRGPGGPNGPYEDEPFSMVVQPDGKMIIVGKAANPRTGNIEFAIIRLLPDGGLDPAFGWGGLALVDFVGAKDEALDVALQLDGKIVVAGVAGRLNGNHDFGLVRLNPNGSRDTSFGWNGLVMTDFFGQADQALGVTVLPDGKIVAGGYSTRPSTGLDMALARYNSNGSLDKTFGLGGISIADYWGRTDAMFKMELLPDGKILGAGVATRPDGTTDFAVARFNSNGAPDSSFGWGGRVATDFYAQNDMAFALLPLANGKVVVGGLVVNPASGSEDLALAKYNANGSLDTTFAPDGLPGRTVVDFHGLYDQALWLLEQPDGKILAFGHARHPERDFDYAIARFHADGRLDEAFGEGGRVTTDFFGGPDGSHAAALFPDGTVVLAGDAYNPATDSDDFAIVRYLMADPSWISGVASTLPTSAFATGQQSVLLAALAAAQTSVETGDAASALVQMQDVRSRVDGCGAAADGDDWIVDCESQLQVRSLVEQVIGKLHP